MPTQEQIDRVLSPYQTSQERNASVDSADGALVRTCYEPTLFETYTQIKEKYTEVMGDGKDLVFDNEALYADLDNNLTNLFLRAPEFPSHAEVFESDDYQLEKPEEEAMALLYDALNRERLLLYVLGEEALRKKMIKLAWFSLGGQLIWWNWLRVSDLQDWEGLLGGLGIRLDWLEERSDDPYSLEKGAHIVLN